MKRTSDERRNFKKDQTHATSVRVGARWISVAMWVLIVASFFLSFVPLSAYAQSQAAPPPLDKQKLTDRPELVDLEVSPVDKRREKYITLFIGIPHDEPLPFFPKDAILKGDFRKSLSASIDRTTNTLRLDGRKEDPASTLIILDNKGKKIYEFRLSVKSSSLTKVAQEMRALLNDIEGISIKIVNEKVVVDGEVLLPKNLNRIYAVVGQFDKFASTLVSLSPVAQKKIAQMIQADINNPEITVRAVDNKFILEGVVQDKDYKDRAEAIAQIYVPDIVKGEAEGIKLSPLKKVFVLNLLQIKGGAAPEPGKTIQITVHFVELNKNYQKAFRFQWTPTISDESGLSITNDSRSPGGVVSSIAASISNLLPKLNWAKTYGHARVLQAANLIVLDGQKGELKNVTRVPYQTLNGQGQPALNFEDVGLSTQITPQILGRNTDSIKMAMDFSVKGLLGITDKGPMISQSSVNTQVIIRSGQSAAVGGLASQTSGTDYNKLPKGTNDNPLISLYASKSYQQNKTQFVIFVTPVIKASASQGSEKIKAKFKLKE
jgi:pilus assembly protein CpaC